jgi:uncharacterized membrane protein
MSKDAGLAHLDAYLAQVQRHLQGLPHGEVREIVAELRAHVLDKVEGSVSPAAVEAAIAELGSPREIARVNITERIVARAEMNRSPLSLLGGVVRLAGLSLYGCFAFVVCFAGYGSAAAFLLTALVKPFAWNHAGLWIYTRGPDDYVSSWALGLTDNPHRGHEVLGGWIIPIGIVAALVLGWLTWRFNLFSLRLMGRRARRPR